MRLPGLPVSARFTAVPDVVDGGGRLPLGFRVTTRRGGLLRCEASLWCTLVAPTRGFRWPPEARLSAEAAKVVVGPEPVGAGEHHREVELTVPFDARPTVATGVGAVRYEVNVVAYVDDRRGLDNRDVVVRSRWIDADDGAVRTGDGPWDVAVEVGPGRPGEPLLGTVHVDGGAGPVSVDARLERYEEAGDLASVSRWSAACTVAADLRPGPDASAPLRFDLPADAVPTVLARTFTERWVLTVTVSGGAQTVELATAVVVLS